jgi:argininosuccinate lyase
LPNPTIFNLISFYQSINAYYNDSGACVRLAEDKEVSIDTLSLSELQAIDARFEEDVMEVWNYEVSVERKSSIGGTSKAAVTKQIDDCIAFAKTL